MVSVLNRFTLTILNLIYSQFSNEELHIRRLLK